MSAKRDEATGIDFDALTKGQREAIGWIAIGDDRAHPQRTLVALQRKGLIVRRQERAGMFVIWRYDMPLAVHMQWCAWCAVNAAERAS